MWSTVAPDVRYTGHVTAGGSVCVEALVNTGTPNGWRPDYCVSSMLELVKLNMVGRGGGWGRIVCNDQRFSSNRINRIHITSK